MSIYRGRTKNEVYLSSLLYDAIEDQDLRAIELLLSVKRADPNLVLPIKRISPFHLIIGNDDEAFASEVTRLILQHGGDPNVKADDDLTPIHIAAAWGRYGVLKLLLDSGGNPEVRDMNGHTPLYYAKEENYADCFELLKLYLPDRLSFNKKTDNCYKLHLDKILVNNGATVGEYEIVNEYKTDSICKKDLEKLEQLPQSDGNEYVMKWFNSLQGGGGISPIKTSVANSDSSESDKESDLEIFRYPKDINHIPFRKVYRKKVKSPKSPPKVPAIRIIEATPSQSSASFDASEFSEVKNFSRESGFTTLVDSEVSDYVSCDSTLNPLERNIFQMTDDSISQVSVKSEGISSNDLSFVSVSEVYKYIDEEKGIVLYERRLLKSPISECNGSVRSFGTSHRSSLPEALDYEDLDSDTLRRELTLLGYNPGPITVTTKRVYLKKLVQLRKHPPVVATDNGTRVFSLELEKTLKNPDWLTNLANYRTLDETVLRQFANPDPSKNWRDGTNKNCFTYLLLDPRITNNLPTRAETMKPKQIWENFLSAIFYVGKGTRSRPYSHLYDAVSLWTQGERSSSKKKLSKILSVWNDDSGVVCLHLFQNSIPVEAYTREAAIIDALKVSNLCNEKRGNYYGMAATWSQKQQTMYGVFLLYKAMMIFLNEGERQLCPTDIN